MTSGVSGLLTGRFVAAVVAEPKLAREVLQGHKKGCALGLTKLPGETNLISSDGPEWLWRRQHEAPVFAGHTVRAMSGLIQEQVDEMVVQLEKRVGASSFDLDKFMCCVALDVIGATAYGRPFGAMSGNLLAADLVNSNFYDAQEFVLNPVRLAAPACVFLSRIFAVALLVLCQSNQRAPAQAACAGVGGSGRARSGSARLAVLPAAARSKDRPQNVGSQRANRNVAVYRLWTRDDG